MITKKQLLKQYKFASELLRKIKLERKQQSLKYGEFAVEVQQNEVNRLLGLINNKN